MHNRKTLVLKGLNENNKVQFKICRGVLGSKDTPSSESSCVRTAIQQVFMKLGKEAPEGRKTLCFNELTSDEVVELLDNWIKERSMMLFVWKGYNGQVVAFVAPSTSMNIEVDEILEDLLDLMIIDSKLASCTGRKENLVAYSVTRASKNVLKVVSKQAGSRDPYVGYAGVGSSLHCALNEVFPVIVR